MANINDWREAFSFLRSELTNEFMHAELQEQETARIEKAIQTAFSNLDKEIGNRPFD